MHGRVEHERGRVDRDRAEREQGEEPVHVGDGRGLDRATERPRLDDEPGEHDASAGRTRSGRSRARGSRRSGLSCEASCEPDAAVGRDEHAGNAARLPPRPLPARNSAFASTSASTASAPTTVTRSRSVSAGRPGRRVDQVVQLAAGAAPAPPVAAGRRERAVGELERDGAVDADRPGAAAHGDVAAGVDEARAGEREQLGRAVGGVALADPAEVEADAGLELDAGAAHAHAAAARTAQNVPPPSAGMSSNERS